MESRRTARGVVQRHVLYLGEVDDSQLASWEKAIEVFDEEQGSQSRLALYPADKPLPAHARRHGLCLRLDALRILHPRQWGACWLAVELWLQLHLDAFWSIRFGSSREVPIRSATGWIGRGCDVRVGGRAATCCGPT